MFLQVKADIKNCRVAVTGKVCEHYFTISKNMVFHLKIKRVCTIRSAAIKISIIELCYVLREFSGILESATLSMLDWQVHRLVLEK